MKMRTLALGLLLSGSLFMVSCQNDGSEGEDARESVVQEDNASNSNDQMASNQSDAQVKERNKKADGAAEDANTPTTEVTFDEKVYDFGEVEKGNKVNYTYKFTNTGDEPLIIKNAKASCGCTVPDWPKEPIAPGEGGEIPVEFNGKSTGKQNKTVTITANTDPAKTILRIKGTVVDPSDS